MKIYPLTTLTEIFAPNSVGAFDFLLTIVVFYGQHFLLLVIEHDHRKKAVTLDPAQAVHSVLRSIFFNI